MINSLIFWFILLFGFYVAYALGARSANARAAAAAATVPPVIPAAQMAAMEAELAPMLAITGHKVFGNIVQFEV